MRDDEKSGFVTHLHTSDTNVLVHGANTTSGQLRQEDHTLNVAVLKQSDV